MLRIHNLLYPIDLSAGTNAAFPHALLLARRHHATIHMMHVESAAIPSSVAETVAELFADHPAEGAHGDDADLRMREIVNEHKGGDVDIEYIHAKHVAVSKVLLMYAATAEIDLIVMDSHGRRGMRRLLVGSVADEMIRGAACPVLIVRHRDDPVENVASGGRLMVPFDFSVHAEHALRYARELSIVYDAPLDVVHVIDPASHTEAYVTEVAEHGAALERLRYEASSHLQNINEGVDDAAVSVAYHVRVGFPPKEITEFAVQNDSEMIIMCSHGQTGKKSIMLGSVAENVVRHAPCAVFIARPYGKSLLRHG